MATASHDGTVRIWDARRFQRDYSIASRAVYKAQEGRIVAMDICENSHSVAAASDKGSIHTYDESNVYPAIVKLFLSLFFFPYTCV